MSTCMYINLCALYNTDDTLDHILRKLKTMIVLKYRFCLYLCINVLVYHSQCLPHLTSEGLIVKLLTIYKRLPKLYKSVHLQTS